MQVKSLQNMRDVGIYFNVTGIRKKSEEPLEREGRTVR